MEYPSHQARRQLRLFFAYGFKNSPETPFPLGEQKARRISRTKYNSQPCGGAGQLLRPFLHKR